jgi:hypothetical protein
VTETTVRRIKVTPAQVAAAKLNIKLSNELGEPVDPIIEAIASATVLRCRREGGRSTAGKQDVLPDARPE